MHELTPLQSAVVQFVREYCAQHGYGPSRSEIKAATGASSPVVQELVRRGVLQRIPGIHRTLRVREKKL